MNEIFHRTSARNYLDRQIAGSNSQADTSVILPRVKWILSL